MRLFGLANFRDSFRVDESGVHQVMPVDSARNPVLTHVTGCTSDKDGNP